MPKFSFKTLFLSLTLIAVAVWIATQWQWATPTVQFVLPDGFTGPFVVVEHPDGEELNNDIGLIRVNIPDSGILNVKSWKPLQDEHKLEVRYRSGNRVLDFHDMGTSQHRSGGGPFDLEPPVMKFFIGAYDDASDYDWRPFIIKMFSK